MQHWQDMINQHWGIAGEITQLDGEYDLNLLCKTADGACFVLKVMRPGCEAALVEMQIAALAHLETTAPDLPIAPVIPTRDGALSCHIRDDQGKERLAWMIKGLEGNCYAHHSPKSPALLSDLGARLGQMDAALADFDHPALTRDFKWNLCQAGWITNQLDAIDSPTRRAILHEILAEFTAIKPTLDALPAQALHNDANDYNILVQATLDTAPHVSGLLDFGDMCRAPRVVELAIAAAYLLLDRPDPAEALAALVAGYHAANPLTPAEIDLIYPLALARLAVSVVNAALMVAETPDDPYVTISQAPAWRYLEGQRPDPNLLTARLRAACGFDVTDAAERILAWLDAERGNFAPLMGQPLDKAPFGALSVEACAEPVNPFDLPVEEAALIGAHYGENTDIWLGYYYEPRLIYTAPAFRKGSYKASSRRTVHLAVDAFAEAQTPIYAPLAGRVHVVENRNTHLDYGGVVILSHETPEGDQFFTLYGHLNPEICERLSIGQTIEKGEHLAQLGDVSQSGGWAPHVHFQLALMTDGMGDDWPGVGDPDEMYLWSRICPNPAPLLNLPDARCRYQPAEKPEVAKGRAAHFAPNLKLSYADPVMFLRGWRHHLFDEWGRPYLDAYNNVPHVGHAHPRIARVAADQLTRMNANTRYLHPAQVAFAETLLAKFPATFTRVFFVNSGSEANELTLRLARAATGGRDMITPDHGYHGNTTGAIDLSAYKFNAPGGIGQPDWVHLVDIPDDYRGKFRRDDPEAGAKYAAQIDVSLAGISARGGKLAGFIAETFPSVGGQILPPPGYLQAVYQRIRAAGGLCIADEVQTGLGRLGEAHFAFETQGVTPDIVVLGKPIGNGHPLGAVITTDEIATRFAEGPEFFSTFGGSNLSCRMGKEVLNIVDDEGLAQNAAAMGARALDGLARLQERHEAIGDVRGMGLFLGVELVTDRATRSPATKLCDYVLNRMREERILMGREGPHDNILKIRPPLTIEAEDIDQIVETLDRILSESAVRAP